jgi:hypothetical protein
LLIQSGATGLIIAGDLSFIIDAYGHGANCVGSRRFVPAN